MHEYPVLIRDEHLDAFGHVNNAVYLALFEEARWDLITRGGYGMDKIRETGLGPVVLEATLRFQREVTGGAKVVIRSRSLEYRGRLGRMEQVMALADGAPACTAGFLFGLFDLTRRKLVKPTPEWLKAIGLPG